MIESLVALAAGFWLLVLGSGRFVRGASALALRLRIPAVVVGAVVIGFGTSAPELLTCSFAAADGARDLAVGSIVGSNAANLTLVVGVVAVLAQPVVTGRILRRELPIMVAGMALLAVAVPRLSRPTAVGLLVAFAAALVLTLRATAVRHDPLAEDVEHELAEERHQPTGALVRLLGIGLLGTVLGAHLLVTAATSIADEVGLADGLVGFTLLALGTSLPEVVTAVQAARRGDPDLALGNVMGSNVFNSLAIGGVSGLISPGEVASGLAVTAWVGVAVALGVVVMMLRDRRLVRSEGVVLIGAYLASIPLVA